MTRPISALSSRFFQETTAARTQMFAAVLLTVLSVILHGQFMLHHAALWRDEVNSVGLATMPTLRELWASLSYDSSPILWPLLLRGWIFYGFGESDASIRFFGFLMQLFLLGGLWFNALSISKRVPLLSLLLLGCDPAIVIWPSLRSYCLGAALILWTFGCLWRALENPTPKRVAITFAMALLSVQCVYANVLLLGAICSGGIIVCLYKKQKKLVLFPCAVFLIAAFSLLIYIPTFIRIAPWQNITLEKITPQFVVIRSIVFMPWVWIGFSVFSLLTIPFLLRNSLQNSPTKKKSDYVLPYAYIVSLLIFLLMTLFLGKAGRQPYAWHFVGLVFLLGSCMDSIYHVIDKNDKSRSFTSLIVMVLSLLFFLSSQNIVKEKRTNIDLAAKYLNEKAGPKDLVVLTPFYMGATYQRYSLNKTPWVTVPDIKEYKIQRYDIVKKLMATSDSLQPVEARILRTLQSGHRVWFVGSLPKLPLEPPRYVLPEAYGPNGWFYVRYLTYCSTQTSYFLSQHGARRIPVTIPNSRQISPLEDVKIEVIEGLKTALVH